MIPYVKKKFWRAIADTPPPVFTEQEWNRFVASPVWLAIRQQSIVMSNAMVDMVFSTEDNSERMKAIGGVCALTQFIDSPLSIKQLMVDDVELLEQSILTENKLKRLFDLTDTEQ